MVRCRGPIAALPAPPHPNIAAASEWVAGPPTGRGHYWIVWREGHAAVVIPVEIGPALIQRDDPTAALLIKTLGGVAYRFEPNRPNIVAHMALTAPRWPR